MVSAIVLSPTDAASLKAVVGSAQRAVVACARAPRETVIQHCHEYLGSEHPDFELEGSARPVLQFEGVLPEAAPCVSYKPIYLDGQVGIVVDVPLEVYDTRSYGCTPGPLPLRMAVDSGIPLVRKHMSWSGQTPGT